MKNYLFLILLSVLLSTNCCDRDRSYSPKINGKIMQKQTSVTTINMMGQWYGEGEKELYVKELVRDFSFLNQDIDVNIKFSYQIFNKPPNQDFSWSDCDTIVQMIKQNKWTFDILLVDKYRYFHIGELLHDQNWGQKYLVNFLDEPWFKEVHKNGLFDSTEISKSYGGMVPGPVIEGISNLIFASEYVENLIGLKVKDYGMTFNDFLSYAKAVNNYNSNHNDKITFLSLQNSSSTTTLFNQLAISALGKEKALNKGEGLQALAKVYDELAELSKYEPIRQLPPMTNDPRALYFENCLFNIQASWMVLLWDKANAKATAQMRPCELPSFKDKKAPYYPGYSQVIFVVPKYSKNREAAMRLMKYFSSTESADKWIKYAKCPTGLKNSEIYSDFGEDKYSLIYKHLQSKYGNNQREFDISKIFFNSDKPFDFKIDDVLLGKITAEEALRYVKMQLR